jgi:hypothetical protein
MCKERGGKNHPKFQDLSGKFNGNLEIIKYVNVSKLTENAKWLWECKCSCGEIIYVRTARLNGTEAFQERCRKCQVPLNAKKRILPDYGAIRNGLFLKYKNKSIVRGYEFNLTFTEFDKLIQQDCYYCGQIPEIHPSDLHILREETPFKRNGIDRKDNNLGYTKENSVPCCTMCNFAKLNFSINQFSEWLNRIYKYQNKELWNNLT